MHGSHSRGRARRTFALSSVSVPIAVFSAPTFRSKRPKGLTALARLSALSSCKPSRRIPQAFSRGVLGVADMFVARAVTAGCFSCDGAGDAVGACARAEMPATLSKSKTPNRLRFAGRAALGRLLMIFISHWRKLDNYLEARIPDFTSRLTDNVHAVPSIWNAPVRFLECGAFASHSKSQNQELGSPTHSSDIFPSSFSPGTEIRFVLRLA
jgi:hypothetical protein